MSDKPTSAQPPVYQPPEPGDKELGHPGNNHPDVLPPAKQVRQANLANNAAAKAAKAAQSPPQAFAPATAPHNPQAPDSLYQEGRGGEWQEQAEQDLDPALRPADLMDVQDSPYGLPPGMQSPVDRVVSPPPTYPVVLVTPMGRLTIQASRVISNEDDTSVLISMPKNTANTFVPAAGARLALRLPDHTEDMHVMFPGTVFVDPAGLLYHTTMVFLLAPPPQEDA